jgi:hypothetical protein
MSLFNPDNTKPKDKNPVVNSYVATVNIVRAIIALAYTAAA